jgi:hypothetical protein
MKTLELKQIAPYLQYNVLFQSSMDKPFDEIGYNPVWTCGGITKLFGDYCLTTIDNSDAYAIQTCRLKLSPLGKLTQDEKTCDEIKLLLEPNGLEINNFLLLKNSLNAVAISWQEMQEVLNILYREHYDVFGLIEQGLAIEKL